MPPKRKRRETDEQREERTAVRPAGEREKRTAAVRSPVDMSRRRALDKLS
jgi:hypothetical protein